MAVCGYDKAFIVSPPEELMCTLCDLVANNPHTAQCGCGGLYCSSCITQLKAKCPNCQQPMKPSNDIVSAHRIATLPVKCDNAEEGCKWVGDLGQLDIHLLSCLKQQIHCPYHTVGCSAQVFRGEVDMHKEEHVHHHLNLAMLRLERLEGKTETPPVVFSLQRFNHKKKYSEEWYSPPFYTHTGGYKMCLRVDANGDGNGRNTHICLYVCLMRGYNDESLVWPFRGEMTVELLNQLQDSGHKSETIHFLSSEENEVNSRVRREERSERGRGLRLFLPHSKLGMDETTHTCYLKEDSLFFRVTAAKVYNSNTPWLTTTT